MEKRIRCTHKLYHPHSVVNSARFCPEPANQTEGLMHGSVASAKSSVGMISAARALPARAASVWTRELPALLVALSSYFSHAVVCHSSWTQHFVCISVSPERFRPTMCCLSARIRRRTTAPTPNCALSPAPFPASSHRTVAMNNMAKTVHVCVKVILTALG